METKYYINKAFDIMEAKGLTKEARDFYNNGDTAIYFRVNSRCRALQMSLKQNLGDELYDKINDRIQYLSQEYNLEVFLVQVTETDFGTLASMFYMGEEEYDNTLQIQDLHDNYICSYVFNVTDDILSEFGSIQFEYDKTMGGIVRIA